MGVKCCDMQRLRWATAETEVADWLTGIASFTADQADSAATFGLLQLLFIVDCRLNSYWSQQRASPSSCTSKGWCVMACRDQCYLCDGVWFRTGDLWWENLGNILLWPRWYLLDGLIRRYQPASHMSKNSCRGSWVSRRWGPVLPGMGIWDAGDRFSLMEGRWKHARSGCNRNLGWVVLCNRVFLLGIPGILGSEDILCSEI